MTQQHRLISDITIGVRHRKRMGDIEGLARSIEAVGLLHPVVIDTDNTLIAGERRIRALLFLGRVETPVTVVDLAEIVRGEFAENTVREDFTLTEAVAIKKAIEPLLKAEAKERQTLSPGRGKRGAKLAPVLKGKTRDKVAKRTGKKRTTLAKAEKVIEAAAKDPEKFGYLVEQMDETDNPTAALRLINKKTDEARILMLEPVVGKFPTLVVDPPWDYEWLSLAGRDRPGRDQEINAKLDAFEQYMHDCGLYSIEDMRPINETRMRRGGSWAGRWLKSSAGKARETIQLRQPA
jgi:ParB-like nuclease family protein